MAFKAARDFLLAHRDDYAAAYARFPLAAARPVQLGARLFRRELARGNDRRPPWLVRSWATARRSSTFAELAERSNRVANHLARARRPARRPHPADAGQRRAAVGVHAGGDEARRGRRSRRHAADARRSRRPLRPRPRPPRRRPAPSTPRNSPSLAGGYTRIARRRRAAAGSATRMPTDARRRVRAGRRDARPATRCCSISPRAPRRKPKLVLHSHQSYPVGHLSTMYWLGLQPGDMHLNISSPGWAKHAWSCFFAPWNAGATVFIANQPRFNARGTARRHRALAASPRFCAPPTVWRMLIQEDLRRLEDALRELVGAGEPLNPEVIEQVRAAWGLTIRDGYGQTETTAQIGNSPGQPVKPGSMGRPLPGYRVRAARCRRRRSRGRRDLPDARPAPAGLMQGYQSDDGTHRADRRATVYRTGDVARARRRRLSTPMSAAPTTSSKPPTTGSARSSWKAR